ncbi:MAG: M28 family peptidase [Candidatus Krumholzibacteriota bacterium]|nr:M28 family peptidase [Candidatus Krumholzibacteriota bacterium]
MLRDTLIIVLAGALLFPRGASADGLEEAYRSVSKSEIRGIIEFLGSDLLEGRAPGTRGAQLAEEYIQSLFQVLEIAPYTGEGFSISGADALSGAANDLSRGYYQEFTLNGFSIDRLGGEAGGVTLSYPDDIVGSYTGAGGEFSLTGEVVFAGFGISSDDWSWDDYKDVSVEGKIVIVRVNEPQGSDESDESLFEGSALTYFGRWTYKIEEAARRGAKGILLVHTTESAGYGWHVVMNSWGGEEVYLDSAIDNDLLFRGWIREEKFVQIAAAAGMSMEDLYGRSESGGFRPVDLGVDIMVTGESSRRSFTTRNVVGFIPGNDPKYAGKAIVLSAHIDHLGMNPRLEGDRIFNGAVDNGSAVASMMVTARHIKEYEKDLKYSVIILACEAEEAGLLGSHYFAGTLDPSKIIANINFESTPVWEKSRNFVGVGAKYSNIEDILKRILHDADLEYSYFSMSDQGFFYRSDQFSFARKGIPSVWLSAGEDFESGRNRLMEFFLGKYHTVDDEYDPEWDLGSAVQTIGVALRLIDYINRETPEIEWKGRISFPVD